MEDIRESTFHTGDLKIPFAEMPSSGPPLVLLHGGGDRWQQFLPIIPSLAMKCHVYALDLRGHGKSGRVPGKYRPEHYVIDVLEFIDRQISEALFLFGHSLGGWIALFIAAERSQRLKGVILGDPPLNVERFCAIEGREDRIGLWRRLHDLAGSDLSVQELANELAILPVPLTGSNVSMKYGDLPGVDEVHLWEWAETLRQVDPDVAQYHAEGRLDEYIRQSDIDNALIQITCPVLLLQADIAHGGLLSDHDVKQALALLAQGSHAKLEGVGHGLGLDRGDVKLLQSIMANFLEPLF